MKPPRTLTLEQLRAAEQRAIDRVQALQTGTSLTRYDTVREAQRVLKQIRTRIENRP
jgi:hypothetical protein